MALPLIGFFTGGLFAKVIGFVLASTVVRVVTAIGFAVVTYTGIDLVMGRVETAINARIGALPGSLLSLLDLYGITFGLQMILSAYTAIITIKGLQSLKRGVLK